MCARTRAGTPCVFWDQLYGSSDDAVKTAVRTLMAIRARNGIDPDAKVKVLTAQADIYVAQIDDK